LFILEGKWGRGLGRTVRDGKQIGVGLGPAHQTPPCAISGYAPENKWRLRIVDSVKFKETDESVSDMNVCKCI